MIRSDNGQTVKCHATHAQAVAHLRALYANVEDAKMSKKNRNARKNKYMSVDDALTIEVKRGARHNAADQDKVQAIHDHAASLGAQCDAGMEKSVALDTIARGLARLEGKGYPVLHAVGVQASPRDAVQGYKCDANYATIEAWDILNAASALQAVANLAQSEAQQMEPDDVSELSDILRALLAFIGGEIDELEEAGQSDDMNAGAAMMSAKAISQREDTSPKEGTAQYGDVQFADETNKKYPIDTADHIRAAWNYIHQDRNRTKYNASEAAAIEKRIAAAWRAKIDKDGPPAASEKSMNFAYVKSLHLPYDEQYFRDVLAVKSIGKDDIQGYNVLWGSPELVDVENDFFTKRTDFWDSVLGFPRPLTWDHGQDPITKGAPIIGDILEFGDDDVGRWYRAQLKRGHQYRSAIDALIQQRAVGTSSDSAPQYVVREKTAKGAYWLKQWPLFAAALTATPAEPRMFDTIHFKSLGVQVPALTAADARSYNARGADDAGRLQIDNLQRRFEILKRSV